MTRTKKIINDPKTVVQELLEGRIEANHGGTILETGEPGVSREKLPQADPRVDKMMAKTLGEQSLGHPAPGCVSMVLILQCMAGFAARKSDRGES